MSPSMSNLQINLAFSPTTRCGGTSISFNRRAKDVPGKRNNIILYHGLKTLKFDFQVHTFDSKMYPNNVQK